MKTDEQLYGVDSGETVHETILDAIDSLDAGQFPAKITVFRRMEPDPKRLAMHVLDLALEHLDEELSDPDGFITPKSPAMIELADKFAEAICTLYVPWACEPTGKTFWVNAQGEVVK